MRVLEVCMFSAGGCGVFARVNQEAQMLSKKGHEVRIYSTNFVKGSEETALEDDKVGEVIIKRFPAKKLGGESFSYFNYKAEALEFRPEAIIVHAYRHIHTVQALKIARKLKAKVFLVTHAPFARERKGMQNKIVWLYDKIFAPGYIKKYDKVIAISKWEMPYLEALGLKKSKIEYIPNGIADEYFSIKPRGKTEDKILFLGRVSPIKNLEAVIEALPFLKDKKIIFEIVGPKEEEYYNKLKRLVKYIGLGKRVVFSEPIYDLKKKIAKIDSAKICILPSKSEGMPQSLIEYLARGKVTIGSNIPGNADLIKDGKNGFLFNLDKPEELARVMNRVLSTKKIGLDKIKKNSIEGVRGFSWSRIIDKIGSLIKRG